MNEPRNDPYEHGVDTGSPFPPVTHDHPVDATGGRLVGLDRLDERHVIEVRTDDHGVLAVGIRPDGAPFAVGNVCRHQLAKLGRGRVTDDGQLECPWHRARYDVVDGAMTEGPKGRVFGFTPYSCAIKAFGSIARLRTFDVEIRESAIWLLQR